MLTTATQRINPRYMKEYKISYHAIHDRNPSNFDLLVDRSVQNKLVSFVVQVFKELASMVVLAGSA